MNLVQSTKKLLWKLFNWENNIIILINNFNGFLYEIFLFKINKFINNNNINYNKNVN